MYQDSLKNSIMTVLLLFCAVYIFACISESSFAIEGLGISILFVIFSLQYPVYEDLIRDVAPTAVLAMFVMISLYLSGRMFERGDYNIPWKFAIKFIYCFFAAAGAFVMNRLPKKKKAIIIKAVVITILLSSIVSMYYVFAVDNMAMRYRQLIGITQTINFDQIFALPILIPGLLLLLLQRKKLTVSKKTWFAATMIIIVCACCSMLATAILLTLLGIVLTFIFNVAKKGSNKTYAWGAVFLIVFLLFLVFRKNVGEWLYGYIEKMPDLLQGRLGHVADILFSTEHENVYTIDRRLELANYSIETFKQHPFFGVGIAGIQYGVIGYHQEWPDFLGVYGIIGTLVIMLIFGGFTARVYKNAEHEVDKKAMILGLILLLVLGCLDPCIGAPALFIIYIVLPNISSLIKEEVCNNE